MKVDIIPVAKIEKKFFNALKNKNLSRLVSNYMVQALGEQNPKEKVPNFSEILNNINHSTVKLPGKAWQITYRYKNSQGTTDINLHNDFLTERPSIIFHHGLGRSSSLQLKIFANKLFLEKFNLFSIKAAHHDSVNELRKFFLNNFTNISTGICASVLAIDEIINTHRNNSNQKIAVVGVSMGGTIAALHYFYFNSADYYFPIISYPNFGEIILDKNIKEFIANYDELAKNKSIKDAFAIPEELKKRPKNKIFPIIADSDELINFEKAFEFWKNYKVTTYDVGHNTILAKIGDIRKLILGKVFP